MRIQRTTVLLHFWECAGIELYTACDVECNSIRIQLKSLRLASQSTKGWRTRAERSKRLRGVSHVSRIRRAGASDHCSHDLRSSRLPRLVLDYNHLHRLSTRAFRVPSVFHQLPMDFDVEEYYREQDSFANILSHELSLLDARLMNR